ncbi:Fc.00g037500.m01.CDS01 [Cosmosporella sp. VM-42]
MRSLELLSFAAAVSAGTVSVPFSKVKLSSALSITKRSSLTLEAFNNITGGGYYAEFQVGTPGQKLGFLLDTGSSDTWVNSKDSDLCSSTSLQTQNGFCMTTFDPDASKTFDEVDRNGFDITYLDGRNIQGDYFNDTVTIDGKAILNQQLGLATQSVRPTGIMGLGFKSNVAARVEYPTVLDNMVSQGFVDTPAFSLYLNDLNAESGNILFGGIDTAKFNGKLATLPLQSDFQSTSTNITSFSVILGGFEVNGPSSSDNVKLDQINANAILDSGSTICLLPDNQVQDVWDKFDVKNIQNVQVPFIDCAYKGEKGAGYTFDFIFSGKTISIPMDEMVIDAFAEIQDEIAADLQLSQLFKGWDGACMFGIGSAKDYGVSSSKFALLGDTFLRSAYVVYDLANEQLGIAQANLNSTSTNIVELKAGDKALPDVEGASNSSSSSDDNDNAGGHVAPALVATLMMAVGALLAIL